LAHDVLKNIETAVSKFEGTLLPVKHPLTEATDTPYCDKRDYAKSGYACRPTTKPSPDLVKLGTFDFFLELIFLSFPNYRFSDIKFHIYSSNSRNPSSNAHKSMGSNDNDSTGIRLPSS